MREYILIGGIGSGKSTVADLFARKGAHCIDLDQVGHRQLLVPAVVEELVQAFGSDILDSDGRVDRAQLARVAFASPDATARLNAITHPRILQHVEKDLEACRDAKCNVVILEVSAFNGPSFTFAELLSSADGTIAVVCPEEERVRRAVARGFSEEDVRERIARQASDAQRRNWADFVLDNSGTSEQLQAQVDSLWNQINA